MSSDHIIVASLIGQGEVGKGDVAEIVGDEVVQALPHLIGAAVGQAVAGDAPGVRQVTGARLPSVSMRISSTVYWSGLRVRR